jgi:hypothetical protein
MSNSSQAEIQTPGSQRRGIRRSDYVEEQTSGCFAGSKPKRPTKVTSVKK